MKCNGCDKPCCDCCKNSEVDKDGYPIGMSKNANINGNGGGETEIDLGMAIGNADRLPDRAPTTSATVSRDENRDKVAV